MGDLLRAIASPASFLLSCLAAGPPRSSSFSTSLYTSSASAGLRTDISDRSPQQHRRSTFRLSYTCDSVSTPYHSKMNGFENGHGHLHQSSHGHAHPLLQQQHSSNGASVARSKHLTVSTAEDPMRSLSASPAPGAGLSDVETNSYINDPPSSGEGEGMDSQFGKAPKSAKSASSGAGSAKRKAAPRTSRACRTCMQPGLSRAKLTHDTSAVACRRQKMRCEGTDNPPCKRCVANGECSCHAPPRRTLLTGLMGCLICRG